MDQSDDDNTRANSPLIGTKLAGQYTILGIIGEGGMGMIYHARQDIVDREVAIKILPPALAQDDINVQRLAREAKALGRLSHANIVTTFDYGFTEKHEPYIVFEFVDGESLQTYLARRGPLPYRESVPFFLQLADAMKYAHANGIVHRDLKPQNIMVIEKDGKTSIKVLDFGIAQNNNDSQRLTRAGEIWGSPNYMSPEQCTGDPVDHLSDIYSAGVVMYRTLSGQLPFTGKSFAETVSKKLNEAVPFLSSLDLPEALHVPDYLEEIVIKCLRRYPDERYQSMGEVKMSLLALAKGENIVLPGLAEIFSGEGTGSKTVALVKQKLPTTSKTRAEQAKVSSSTGKSSGTTSMQTTGVRKANISAGSLSQTKVQVASAGNKWTRYKPFLLPVVAFAIVCVAAFAIFMAGIEIDRNFIRPTVAPPPQSPIAPVTPRSAAPVAVPDSAPAQGNAPVHYAVPASVGPAASMDKEKVSHTNKNVPVTAENTKHKKAFSEKPHRSMGTPQKARNAFDSSSSPDDSGTIHHYVKDRDGNGFYEQFGGAGGR